MDGVVDEGTVSQEVWVLEEVIHSRDVRPVAEKLGNGLPAC